MCLSAKAASSSARQPQVSVLQCDAASCSVMQNTLGYTWLRWNTIGTVGCSVLQCVSMGKMPLLAPGGHRLVCCTGLQQVAA